jgi:hypothetical protein
MHAIERRVKRLERLTSALPVNLKSCRQSQMGVIRLVSGPDQAKLRIPDVSHSAPQLNRSTSGVISPAPDEDSQSPSDLSHFLPNPILKQQCAGQSVRTDAEPGIESVPEELASHTAKGLSTTATSLSKATAYLQTPATPGEWAHSPAARPVQFQPGANLTGDCAGSSDVTNGVVSREGKTQTVSPPATLELAGPWILPSPVQTRSPPGLLDAYGNEQDWSAKEATTEPRASIKALDPPGQTTDNESMDGPLPGSPPARDRDELISWVHRRLSGLVQEIDDMDRLVSLTHFLINIPHDGTFNSRACPSSALSRVKELDTVSVHARDRRRTLDGELKASHEEIKHKFSSLREIPQKSSTWVRFR